MTHIILVILELITACLFQQREHAAYLKYLLTNPFEVKS